MVELSPWSGSGRGALSSPWGGPRDAPELDDNPGGGNPPPQRHQLALPWEKVSPLPSPHHRAGLSIMNGPGFHAGRDGAAWFLWGGLDAGQPWSSR